MSILCQHTVRCLLSHRGFKHFHYQPPNPPTTCTSTFEMFATMTPYFIVSQSSVTADSSISTRESLSDVRTEPPIFYNSIFRKFLCFFGGAAFTWHTIIVIIKYLSSLSYLNSPNIWYVWQKKEFVVPYAWRVYSPCFQRYWDVCVCGCLFVAWLVGWYGRSYATYDW